MKLAVVYFQHYTCFGSPPKSLSIGCKVQLVQRLLWLPRLRSTFCHFAGSQLSLISTSNNMDFALFCFLYTSLTFWFQNVRSIGDIIAAVNTGGKAHTDIWGITYQSDPLEGRVGVSSDYGRRFLIGRVPPEDQILYQTERYNIGNFEYSFRIPDDGDYIVVLKFSEVYFGAVNEKIFSVAINDHVVVSDLDIYSKVGRAVAYDEVIPFTIKKGNIHVGDEASKFDGTINIQFLKGSRDNPKVNALYVMKGTIADVPPMPPLEIPEEEMPKHEEEPEEPEHKSKFASGPKVSDPYAQQEVSQMFIPILVAFACFFPVLFCLCRL